MFECDNVDHLVFKQKHRQFPTPTNNRCIEQWTRIVKKNAFQQITKRKENFCFENKKLFSRLDCFVSTILSRYVEKTSDKCEFSQSDKTQMCTHLFHVFFSGLDEKKAHSSWLFSSTKVFFCPVWAIIMTVSP